MAKSELQKGNTETLEYEEFRHSIALAHCTFKNYEPQNKSQAKAKEFAIEFARNPHTGIYIHGSVGVGKSHLAVAIYRIIKDIHKAWFQIDNLLSMIKNLISKEDGEYDRVLRKLKGMNEIKYFWSNGMNRPEIVSPGYEILFVDDLGMERKTDFSMGLMAEIISNRYDARTPMVITSNLSLDELSKVYDDRMVSRIAGMCGRKNIIKIEGEDWRVK